MNRDSFIAEFTAMGFQIEVPKTEFIAFPFTIPVGKLAGTKIKLGLQILGDAPINPIPGPHISPPLLPPNTTAEPHPKGGIHASPLGDGWQYWSRPFKEWKEGERTARRYMAHLNNLFATL
jgi:hypothetical protein